MIFDTVRIVGSSNVDLPIKGLTPASNYILKQIDGLGPPDIDVLLQRSTFQSDTYANYQGSNPQSRQIVLRVKLNPNWSTGQTVESLRFALYKMISLPSMVPTIIRLRSAGVDVVETSCYISKFEIVPFSKDPEVQITFECVSPFLVNSAAVNPSLAGLSKSAPVFTHPGDAPTGFRIQLTLTAGLSSWKITKQSDTTRFILVTYAFLSGDIITIDTRPGSKEISRTRAGVVLNLIGNLSSDSNWLKLYNGTNTFTTSSQVFNWTIATFTPLWWGV